MRKIQIKNFEAYRIREDGLLETNWRTGAHYPGMSCKNKWKLLNKKHREDGYIPVCLRAADGPQRRTYMHRLVAETFIGPPPFPKACVRHLDGNSKNNIPSNLAWGTYKENENDKIKHGTYHKRITNVKLTKAIRKLITKMSDDGYSDLKIAEKIGVSRPTINRFLNGRTWK